MLLAGRSIPNPDDDHGVSIEKHTPMLVVDSLTGAKISLIQRYPNPTYGGGYSSPRYVVKLTWTDLVKPELDLIEAAIDDLAVNLGILQLDGIKTARTDITDPPEYQGAIYPDELDVTLASGEMPQIEVVEGWRAYNGVTYGPVLYKMNLTLIGMDGRYLQENVQ